MIIFRIINLVQSVFFLHCMLWAWLVTGFLVAYSIWFRIKSEKTMGTYLGYEGSRAAYFPVVEFTDSKGNVRHSRSDVGSSAIEKDLTGTTTPVYYMEIDGNLTVHVPNKTAAMVIFGVTFAISAAFFMILQMSIHPHWYYYVAALALFIPEMLKLRVLEAIRHHAFERHVEREDAPIHLVPPEDVKAAVENRREVNRKVPYRVLAAGGVVCVVLSVFVGREVFNLTMGGVRAPGKIVGFQQRSSNHSVSYYPTVIFINNGQSVQFQDRVGSSIPENRGDVTVLFDPADPARAMIDRGIWNFLAAGVLALMGVFIIAISLSAWEKSRRPLTE